MKRISVLAVLCIMLLIPALALAMPSVYPTGTTIYKPDKAWNGFTILAGQDGKLVDMNGNLVKTWPGVAGFPNKIFPGGFLLTSVGSWAHGYQDTFNVEIRDFDNKPVFTFNKLQEGKANQGDGKVWMSRQHHDFEIKGNPVGYYIPDQQPIDPKKGTMLILGHYNVVNPKINKARLISDCVYEVDMASGEIKWMWKVDEHFDEMGFDAAAVKAMQAYDTPTTGEGDGFDWFHINCVSYVGPNKWYDQGDKRFHPDNIIFDGRETNILAIADRETGKIVWQTGPNYDKGDDKKLGWIIGQHHTHMIPKGLPGEGNILVYDNGGFAGFGEPNPATDDGILNARRDWTRIIEFNPVTKDIVWEYSPKTLKIMSMDKTAYLFGFKEYSPFISSAQRLPNGNTMICEGATGRVFEVTKEMEVVWEYINPYLYSAPPLGNLTYRAYRVPYDWVPQLPKGKEVEVDPGSNATFQIPAKDGSKPDIGADKTKVWNKQLGRNQ